MSRKSRLLTCTQNTIGSVLNLLWDARSSCFP